MRHVSTPRQPGAGGKVDLTAMLRDLAQAAQFEFVSCDRVGDDLRLLARNPKRDILQ